MTASVMSLAFLMLPAPPAAPQGGLTLTPSHLSPTIAAGDETREIVALSNNAAEAMTVKVSVEFPPGDKDTAPQITVEPGILMIEPGGSEQATLAIRVPADSARGTQPALVRFDASPVSGRDVAILGGVAALIDIKVIDPVDEVSWSFPRIIDSMSAASFSVTARNAGNFSTQLTGTVELAGPVASERLSSSTSDVGVGESAGLEIPWTDQPIFAIRKATLSVTSGTGEPVREEALIIVLPWKLAMAAAGLLVAPFLVVRFARSS